MRRKIITLGATAALVMSMGSAALAAPAQPGSGNPATDPQFHAGHWGYVKSGQNAGKNAKGVPATVFHAPLLAEGDGPKAPGYAPGVGGWADFVRDKQGPKK